MKKIVFVSIFVLIASFNSMSQVRRIYCSGTNVKIIVTGSIRGTGGGNPAEEDPIPLLVYYISNRQDGSANESAIAFGTHYWKNKPDTISFVANSPQNPIYICAISDFPIVSSNMVTGSAFYLDINGTKDTITQKNVINLAGFITTTKVFKDEKSAVFSLDQNFPNPFESSTNITFETPENSAAQITIYDQFGRLVKILRKDILNSGVHSISWDGNDEKGNKVSTGNYFYQLKIGESVQTKKMLKIN